MVMANIASFGASLMASIFLNQKFRTEYNRFFVNEIRCFQKVFVQKNLIKLNPFSSVFGGAELLGVLFDKRIEKIVTEFDGETQVTGIVIEISKDENL